MAIRLPNLNTVTGGPGAIVADVRRVVEGNMSEVEAKLPVPKLSQMVRISSNPGIKLPGVTEFVKKIEGALPVQLPSLAKMMGGKEVGAPSKAPGGIVQLYYE